ncbi:MAG: hypothetical protein HDS65_07685 [Bacteroidales bacterium]|nr:hypothetical protein [Bacteroidales bacterium]
MNGICAICLQIAMPAKIAQKIHFKILRQQKSNITICKYAIYERLLKFFVDSSAPGCVPTQRTALSVVVGGYKQAVTMFARRNNIAFNWQGRYHDHIIRGAHDGNRIDEYIENNVARWDADCYKTN